MSQDGKSSANGCSNDAGENRGGTRRGAGRPRLPPEQRLRQVKAYLRPDVMMELQVYRNKHGLSTSAAVALAVRMMIFTDKDKGGP